MPARWAVVAGLVAACGPGAGAQVRGPQVARGADARCDDATAVVRRAVAFVRQLGQELGSVVASEDYRQELVGPVDESPQPTPPPITIMGSIRVTPAAPMTRRHTEVQTLRSSFLFVRLPAEETWVGFRDVERVNGRRVGDARSPAPLDGAAETSIDRWRRLSQDSARHNIGTITRTLNVPTFALIVLHASNTSRFAFTASADPSVPGVCVVAFQETASPTIVRGALGADVPSSGTFRIEPATGRVRQSELVTGSAAAGVGSTSVVRYDADARLGLWLPVEMREDYRTKWGERLLGIARYTDYRKANVSVTIRPDP
jgi:hypothetical protein